MSLEWLGVGAAVLLSALYIVRRITRTLRLKGGQDGCAHCDLKDAQKKAPVQRRAPAYPEKS